MTSRTFLRLSLALPVLVPAVALISGSTSGVAFILVMSLALGGVPYAMTAVVLWWLLGKCNSVRSLIRAALLAPILFALLQASTWLLWELSQAQPHVGPNSPAYRAVYSSLALAAYGLAIGYLYVLLVLTAFFAAIRLHLLSPPNSATSPSPGNAA